MRKNSFVARLFVSASFVLVPWVFAQEVRPSVTGGAVSSKPTVAVRDFEFGTIQKWWEGELNVGRGVSDMLVEQLLQTGALRILERSQLEAVMAEQDLANSIRTAASNDARTGEVVRVQYLVTGSVTKFGGEQKNLGIGAIGAAVGAFTGQAYLGMADIKDTKAQVEITARVIDTTTGEVIAAVRSRGESKRKGFILSGMGARNGKVAGSAIEMGASNFRETLLGEATSAAVHDAAQKLVAALAR